MIRTMHDLTVGVFEHVAIKSDMDVDKMINYMQRIIRGTAIKKYTGSGIVQGVGEVSIWRSVESGRNEGCDHVTVLVLVQNGQYQRFWGDIFSGPDRCNYYKKELWFELGKSTWRKYQHLPGPCEIHPQRYFEAFQVFHPPVC